MSRSSKPVRDNRANQLSPTHPAYFQSRGLPPVEAEQKARLNQSALDNHANQLNPNSAAHAASRGELERGSMSAKPPQPKHK
jgi:hypothetical protein